MARRTTGGTPALSALERAGIPHRTHPYGAPGALGTRRRLPVVVDASALEHPTVFCSAARRRHPARH